MCINRFFSSLPSRNQLKKKSLGSENIAEIEVYFKDTYWLIFNEWQPSCLSSSFPHILLSNEFKSRATGHSKYKIASLTIRLRSFQSDEKDFLTIYAWFILLKLNGNIPRYCTAKKGPALVLYWLQVPRCCSEVCCFSVRRSWTCPELNTDGSSQLQQSHHRAQRSPSVMTGALGKSTANKG